MRARLTVVFTLLLSSFLLVQSAVAARQVASREDLQLARSLAITQQTLDALLALREAPPAPPGALSASALDVYEHVVLPNAIALLREHAADMRLPPERKPGKTLNTDELALGPAAILDFYADRLEALAPAELARLRALAADPGAAAAMDAGFVEVIGYAAEVQAILPLVADEAERIFGTVGFVHKTLLKVLWTIIDKIIANIPNVGDIYKKLFEGAHGLAH